MNLVFACDSIWNWECEKEYAILREENPDLVRAARRGTAQIDPETGLPVTGSTSRKGSYAVAGDGGQRRSSLARQGSDGVGGKASLAKRSNAGARHMSDTTRVENEAGDEKLDSKHAD